MTTDKEMKVSCWTCFIFVTALISAACALQCNACYFDTLSNENSCNTTHENCMAEWPFCMTQSEERPDGSRIFTRGCAPLSPCKPDYCEETLIKMLGRKDCNITCCQEDLCNRDGYGTAGSEERVSRANRMLEYFVIIIGICFSLLGRQL